MSVNGSGSGSGKGRRAVDSCRDEFTLVVEGGKPKMQCNHCGVVISNHTVTLKNHLARKHGVVTTGTGGTPASPATAAVALSADTRAEEAAAAGPHHSFVSSDEAKSDALRKRSQRSNSHSGDDAGSVTPLHATAAEANGDKKRRLAAAEPGREAQAEDEEGTESDAPSDAGEADETAPLLDRQEFVDMNKGADSGRSGLCLCTVSDEERFLGWQPCTSTTRRGSRSSSGRERSSRAGTVLYRPLPSL